jgi:hypothetical protein
MSAQCERRIAFAEACRALATTALFPSWRYQLLEFACLSDREAELVEQSLDCIAESKYLIGRTDILLHHR